MKSKLILVAAGLFLVALYAQKPRGPSTTAKWGQISGDINQQTDLQQQFGSKQATLPIGTQTQYYRGDQTLAEFPATSVAWGQISGTLSNQGDLQAALNQKANLVSPISLQSGVSYTLSAGDNGAVVAFNNSAAISLVIPTGLPPGFSCLILQLGTGQVSVSGSNVSIQQRQKFTKTAGQYAVVSVISFAKDTFVLSGDMQ